MLWWNGSPLPVPSAPLSYSYRDIEGTNSGQTLGGYYSKKVIARKEDIDVKWEGLSPEDAAVIAGIKRAVYGRLTYYSPQAGAFITSNVYTEDLTEDINAAALNSGELSAELSAALKFKQR